MTRLTVEIVGSIPATLTDYDAELREKTGASLIQIAERAAGCGKEVERFLRNTRAAVVPVTAGRGIIEGFTEAVASILRHLRVEAYVTNGKDVEGFREAVLEGCNLIFAADDEVFAAFNLKKRMVSDNSEATGRAYAAALELRAGDLNGKAVSLVGAGKVGSAALEYMVRKGAHVHIHDKDISKLKRLMEVFRGRISAHRSIRGCLEHSRLLLQAAPAVGLIPERLVDNETIVSAPAIPLGLTEGALRKLPKRNLIHDPLQLGVATMAIELMRP